MQPKRKSWPAVESILAPNTGPGSGSPDVYEAQATLNSTPEEPQTNKTNQKNPTDLNKILLDSDDTKGLKSRSFVLSDNV